MSEWKEMPKSELEGLVFFVKLNPSQIITLDNVRKYFDEVKLQELAESIRENGIIEPLIVRPTSLDEACDFKGDSFELIAGERRLRAARLIRLEKVPARVMFINKKQAAKLQLIENVQREDLSPIEEAHAYRTLLGEHDYTQEALGEELGVSQGHIANRIRLLDLPDSVQENISRGIISPSHGKVLAGYKALPESILIAVAEHISKWHTSVVRTDEVVTDKIVSEGRPLFKNWRNDPQFSLKVCKNCDQQIMVKGSAHYDKAPYCINKDCWETKQSEAVKLKRQVEEEKSAIKEAAEKEQEREVAAQRKADVKASLEKVEEKIQKTISQIRSVPTFGIQCPEITALIEMGRAAWEEKEKSRTYQHHPDTIVIDRESIITLEGLLEYWRAKNEICKEATNMPEQLGDSTIVIQEQGIRFRGSEPYIFSGGKRDKAEALRIEGDKLTIANTNGQVIDSLPVLPIYYRIKANNLAIKSIYQMVAIKTPSRTIIVFGDGSATMLKEIFAYWIQLVNELPSVVEEEMAEGVA